MLIADIGATNARFALVEKDSDFKQIKVLKTRDYTTLSDAIESYLQAVSPNKHPKKAAIAVACPVLGDQIDFTNNHWKFSIQKTKKYLKFDDLHVINDFTAVSLSLPHIPKKYLVQVGGKTADKTKPIVVLGPGSGLGVGALIPDGKDGFIPVATEGGHVTMSAANDEEAELISILRHRYKHVSAERVLSGPGLVNIYTSLGQLRKETADILRPNEIVEKAQDGSCKLCLEAVNIFCGMLGTIAGNLAVSYGALGGVYLAGGILPQMQELFLASKFRNRFESKGRFEAYLSPIPVYMITHDQIAFLGLKSLMNK